MIEVLLNVLTVEKYIIFDNNIKQIKSSNHRCNLRDVLKVDIKTTT